MVNGSSPLGSVYIDKEGNAQRDGYSETLTYP
jgi:hypothetical protein